MSGIRRTYTLKIAFQGSVNDPKQIYTVSRWGKEIPQIGERLELRIGTNEYCLEVIARKLPLWDHRTYGGKPPTVWTRPISRKATKSYTQCGPEPEYHI